MAAFDFDFPDDFMSDLLDTEFEEIAEEALSKCAPVLQDSIKKSIDTVVQDGTGQLVNSVKIKGPKKTKTDGYIINVGPSGTGKKGAGNVQKAVWLEYGSAHQAPRPWLETATRNAEGKVMEQMQQIYDQKVGAKT